jgi:hypothetical protein
MFLNLEGMHFNSSRMAGGGGDGAAAAKPALGVIFLGHVDSGKSTLIGHLMLKQGAVDAKCVGSLQHLHKHRTCAMQCNRCTHSHESHRHAC